jgi:hypothetical protein
VLPAGRWPSCLVVLGGLLCSCGLLLCAATSTKHFPRADDSSSGPQSAVLSSWTRSVDRSSAVRSRSRKILAGRFGWGTIQPLQIAGAGLIDWAGVDGWLWAWQQQQAEAAAWKKYLHWNM